MDYQEKLEGLDVVPPSVPIDDLEDITLSFELITPGHTRSVDPSLVTTSKHVLKFAGYYLDVASSSSEFRWSSFTSAVKEYCSSHSDLRPEKYESKSLHQGSSSVVDMVGKISKYVLDTFQVSDAINTKEMSAIVETTFTNLKSSSASGFAAFVESSNSSNSAYEYRVAFSYPHQTDPSKFRCLIATIALRASISHESSWWGLVSETRSDFSADVTGLELEVTQGFVSPPRP